MIFIIFPISACALLGLGMWLTRLFRGQLRAPHISAHDLHEEEGPDTLFGVLAGALMLIMFGCSIMLAAWIEGMLFSA